MARVYGNGGYLGVYCTYHNGEGSLCVAKASDGLSIPIYAYQVGVNCINSKVYENVSLKEA